jgi:hypothetical protein
MLVPLWSLLVICFLRKVVLANSEFISNTEIRLPVPFFYNIPLRPLSNMPGTIFNVTDCNEWYMYHFTDNVTSEDKSFFGFNEGEPIRKPKSHGMLDSKTKRTRVFHISKNTKRKKASMTLSIGRWSKYLKMKLICQKRIVLFKGLKMFQMAALQ